MEDPKLHNPSSKLQYLCKQTPNTVFEYLTEISKFISIHPVIYKMDKIGPNEYMTYEHLKMGFMPISLKYPSTIEGNPAQKTVIMQAEIFKIATIHMHYSLKSTEEGFCEVTEEVHVKCFLPIKKTILDIFKKHHQEMFDKLSAMKVN